MYIKEHLIKKDSRKQSPTRYLIQMAHWLAEACNTDCGEQLLFI